MRRILGLVLLLSIAHAAGAQTTDRATEELRAEMVFWESVRSSTDSADYRAYLEQYPDGKFAVLARNRLASLAAQPSPSTPTSSAPAGAATQQIAPHGAQTQDTRGQGRGRRGRQGTQQPQ